MRRLYQIPDSYNYGRYVAGRKIHYIGKGYFGGGYTDSYSNEIDGIQFSDESAINPSATLALARQGLAGVQSGEPSW